MKKGADGLREIWTEKQHQWRVMEWDEEASVLKIALHLRRVQRVLLEALQTRILSRLYLGVSPHARGCPLYSCLSLNIH